ncbi:MAG: MgtC/SapB family protein, partial [Solobacterium sp.]|nr:MgtC/SapB family protein [Solobacterium sp.]
MEIQGVPFTFGSVLFRMILSAAVSGVIGYGRTVRGRPSGLRTYMVTGIGATLSVLISLFVYEMLKGAWSPAVEAV